VIGMAGRVRGKLVIQLKHDTRWQVARHARAPFDCSRQLRLAWQEYARIVRRHINLRQNALCGDVPAGSVRMVGHPETGRRQGTKSATAHAD